MSALFDRRAVIKILTTAFTAGPLLLEGTEKNKPLYFTKDEFSLLDHLTELIIPTDDHSPGAQAAGVAIYIDRTVAEAFLPEEKEAWNKGLAEMDRLSNEEFGRAFLKMHKDEQISLLRNLSKGDGTKTEGERFFNRVKSATIFAYYTSEIGLHKEMEYKGNVIQPNEFAGYDAV